MSAISIGKCRYWVQGSINISEINHVLPKLISRYELKTNTDQYNSRQDKARYGLPIWTMVVHYNPNNIGELNFWLLTTGFRASQRSKVKDPLEIKKLNKELQIQENLTPIITQNPNEFLTFGEYVLGTYIVYPDLKDDVENEYLFPHNYGIPIDPLLVSKNASLSFQSINGIKTNINLDRNLDENEELKYQRIKENFGFLYMKDAEPVEYTQNEALNILKKKYGIRVDPETSYQDILKLLNKSLTRTNNQYLHIFKRKSAKKIRFTWYLNDEFLKQTKIDIEKKIKIIPSRPKSFEDSLKRLHAKGNYHGVRYQIGKISGRVKMIVKENYPVIFEKLSFPSMLHYVRYTQIPYSNFKEFQLACITETILAKKNKELRLERDLRLRNMRTAIRKKNPELINSSPTTLNSLINKYDKKGFVNTPEPTQEEISNFINEHREMNPALISETY
ncbi:hypothetical protein HLH17_16455 [Acinetobacter sp. ANC 5380]|uniref:Uncharacterized protein n=1 Tax=Acinetobacter terrae TaxID=2731247 RepID=A0A7Y2RI72_9GAMM|nr:hypothetical protein [Acinetobacter terrae]NNH79210.1 hypothetical protein [Acinetobacter terrae]